MPRFSANISTLFQEYPVLERFDAARRAGFSAVEIQFPYAIPLDDLVRAKRAAGVTVALINLPAGDVAAGERGLAGLPGRQSAFAEAIARGRRYAEALGCPTVNALAGIPSPAAAIEDCLDVLAENLHAAAVAFATAGIRVVTEAINDRDIPGFLMTTSAAAVAAITRADHPNLALQYDIYHMHIMEGDLLATLARLGPRIGHVQFADAPGRHEPGSGEIDFAALFAALDAIGYDGWTGAEYMPSTTTEESLEWFAGFR